MNSQDERGNNSSSLPLLLTISTAVLLTAGGGWFLLDDDFLQSSDETGPLEETAASPAISDTGRPAAAISETGELSPDFAGQATALSGGSATDETLEPTLMRQDANLRKGRLAAEADMLAYPPNQSALYYYNQILDIDAGHAIARAELDAVLGRIGQTTTAHMAVGEYSKAHALAVLVSQRNPNHQLVQGVARELDRLTNIYVEQAIQFAQDGRDADVDAALATAEALPGRNADYFSAVRDSIGNIRSARLAKAQGQLETVRLAAIQATTAWVEKVRDAITAGRLISPSGENAVEYLADPDSPESEKEALVSELTSALLSECSAKIDAGSLTDAERLLDTAAAYLGDVAEIQALQATLQQAFIAAQSERVLVLENFVRVDTTPAQYPRRALNRDIQGWVEVMFTVTAAGNTADIEVLDAMPPEIFDRASVEAVQKWTFEPHVFRGEAIDQRTSAKLVFRFE